MKKQKIISVIPERFNREPSDFKRRWVPAFAGMTCLIIAAIFAINALADFTVGKPMTESFEIYRQGIPRTAQNLSGLKNKLWRNHTSLGWQPGVTFRNLSTPDADYVMYWTPAVAGYHQGVIYANNTAIWSWKDTVRAWDIDTMYANARPTLTNMSGEVARTGMTNYTTLGGYIVSRVLYAHYSSGDVSLPAIASGSAVVIYQGTAVPLTFNLGQAWNLTGKRAEIRIHLNGSANSMVDDVCTVTDAVNGACTYTLTTSQTETVGLYTCVIEVQNPDGSSPEVAMRFYITIKPEF